MRSKITIIAIIILLVTVAGAFSFRGQNNINDFDLYTYFNGVDKDTLEIEAGTPEALNELDKLIQHYEANPLKIKGSIKVTSSMDEVSDKEEPFEMAFYKADYQMKYGQAETLSNDSEVVVVDISDKTILIVPKSQANGANTFSPATMSLSAVKNKIQNISFHKKDNLNVLDILMDSVNKNSKYSITYNPVGYYIQSISVSIGYSYPSEQVSSRNDSSQNGKNADSLIITDENGDHFNTGYVVNHELFQIEIKYLDEQKLDILDLSGSQYVVMKNGRRKLTNAYKEYKLIDAVKFN